MSAVSTMIDDFVSGTAQSEANLSFTLTEEQMGKIKSTFSPVQFEDKVRFEFHASGKIIVATVDKGVRAWVEISTVEMDLKGEQYQEFYLDKARINKLSDACKGSMTFNVADGEVEVKIGSIDLHITLPMYELALDEEEPTVGDKESLSSETVADLCSRCLSSKGAGPFMLPVMTMGSEWLYGTSQSITVVKGGFEKLRINVVPSFIDYISNLAFTKEDITFQLDDTNNVLTVSSDNVNYRITTQLTEFNDLSPLMEESEAACLTLNTLPTISDLGVLSIPLIGIDDATFTMKVEEGAPGVDISVKDEGNKLSYSHWDVVNQRGSFDTTLNISAYLQVVNSMSKDNVSLSVREIAIILRDEKQTSVIMAYM
jgi:hypothetical protein